MKVKECMCTKVTKITPQDTVINAAKLMQQNHIGCLPVCDEQQQLCGLITDRDIVLRAVACNKDTNNTMISEIMTTQPLTCKQDDEMSNAQSQMEINQIRRLPVCDNQNKVVGMLTLGNLANNQQIKNDQVGTTLENICNCQGQAKNAE